MNMDEAFESFTSTCEFTSFYRSTMIPPSFMKNDPETGDLFSGRRITNFGPRVLQAVLLTDPAAL